MPLELGVSKEEIRVLAAAVGQREAARQLGISQNTVKSICHRAGDGKRLSQAVTEKAKKALHPNAPSVADTLESALKEDASATRVGLTRYAKRMAEQANTEGTLEEAPLYKAVADIHAKMHPEAAPSGSVNLSFFQIRHEHVQDTEERPVIDV